MSDVEPVSRFANLKRIEFTESLAFKIHRFLFRRFAKQKAVTLICAPRGEQIDMLFVEKGTHKIHRYFPVHESDIAQYVVDFQHYLELRKAFNRGPEV